MSHDPLERLFDSLDWEVLPEPNDIEAGALYATHRGILKIGEIELHCYVLNTGQRIIDADDVDRFFGQVGGA